MRLIGEKMKQLTHGVSRTHSRIWLLMTLLAMGSSTYAADTTTPKANPAETGHIIDTQQQLVWQVCPVGQTWQATTCAGKRQTYSWTEALSIAQSLFPASEWRLPTQTELKHFLKANTGENAPAPWFIKPSATANATDPDFYWTSSVGNGYQTGAWAIQANSQTAHFYYRQTKGWVLLVRNDGVEVNRLP